MNPSAVFMQEASATKSATPEHSSIATITIIYINWHPYIAGRKWPKIQIGAKLTHENLTFYVKFIVYYAL